MAKSKKKILIIVATHGDERIGLEVVEWLKKKKFSRYFDCFTGNPRALRRGIRFTDADLNRSYPGAKNSPDYEKRLAYKNLQRAKGYQWIIDIHEAKSGINDFVIISRKRGCNSFPLDLIDLGIVLFWPSPKGPLGQFLDNSIELEFGMKGRNRRSVVSNATRIVAEFIERLYNLADHKKLPQKKSYYVYGKIMSKDFEGDPARLKDFRRTTVSGEIFYPLLVGQYLEYGIVCYKMKLISVFKI